MDRGSNSGRGKRFFLLQNRPDLLWGPPRYWDSFPRIEQPRLEVDSSPLRSTNIKNKWSYTPYSPYLNVILLSTPGSPKWSLSQRFPNQNPIYASLPSAIRGVDGNLHCAFHCTLIWRYKEVLLLLLQHEHGPYFHPVCRSPPIRPKHTHYCAFPPNERTC